MPSNKVQINDAHVWEVPDSYMDDLEVYLANIGSRGMPDDGEDYRERLEGESAAKAKATARKAMARLRAELQEYEDKILFGGARGGGMSEASAEIDKVEADEDDYGRAELDKIKAETRLLNAQASKLEQQNRLERNRTW